MAEELVMNVKSNIKSVTKETQDWAKSLKEVNEQIEIQESVITDLDKDLIKLKAQQDKIPKGAWVAGMGKLNTKIKETSTELKLEKNALKELKGEQQKASAEVKKFSDAQKESDKSAKDSIGNFTVMGVSLNSVKTAMGKVIPAAKAMFGSIKAGLMSTGIGAFIIAIGSLVSYFTNTKRGADQLAKVFAGLGAVVDVITDRFSSLGELIVGVFNDPKKAIADLWEALKKNIVNRITGVIDQFKALGKVLQSALSLDWDGVTEGAKEYGQALVQVTTGMDTEQQAAFANGFKNITAEMQKEIDVMVALKQRTQELRDADMEFMIQKAATRQEIEKARLIAEDETKSAQERLDNLKKALELEEETTNRELELARERVAIQQEEMLQSENLVADEQKLAELKVALIEKETASVKMRRRVVTEVNALDREIATEQRAREKARLDGIEAERKALQDIMDLETERLNQQLLTAAGLLDEHHKSQLDAQTNEKNAVIDKWFAIIEAEEEGSAMRLELEKAYQEQLAAIDEKYKPKDKDVVKDAARTFKQLSDQEVKWADMTANEKMNIAHKTA